MNDDNTDLEFERTGAMAFFVPGIPAPGGSKRFVGMNKRTGRAVLIDDAGERNTNWRAAVASFARVIGPVRPWQGPLQLTVTFFMPRPKSHYRTGKHAGELKPGAPRWHIVKPDATKLLRSTEDALTGIAWADDAQICQQSATKEYSEQPGAFIEISPVEEGV